MEMSPEKCILLCYIEALKQAKELEKMWKARNDHSHNTEQENEAPSA